MGVIGPISTPNDYLNSMMQLACSGAAEAMPFQGTHGKSFNQSLQ